MKSRLTLIFVAFCISAFGQTRVFGTYTNSKHTPTLKLCFNPDSTFSYWSSIGPLSKNADVFEEKGHWTKKGDTIILNPALSRKPLAGYQFFENLQGNSDSIQLTVELITKYFDSQDRLISTDTSRVNQFDVAFNQNSRKNRYRISNRPTTRCAFAGYIPKEIITHERSITLVRQAARLENLFVACMEFGGTREFLIGNPKANNFTLYIYNNRYQDGQIRQVKYLAKNDNVIFIKQKANGKFQRDGLYMEDLVIRRVNPSQLQSNEAL